MHVIKPLTGSLKWAPMSLVPFGTVFMYQGDPYLRIAGVTSISKEHKNLVNCEGQLGWLDLDTAVLVDRNAPIS